MAVKKSEARTKSEAAATAAPAPTPKQPPKPRVLDADSAKEAMTARHYTGNMIESTQAQIRAGVLEVYEIGPSLRFEAVGAPAPAPKGKSK